MPFLDDIRAGKSGTGRGGGRGAAHVSPTKNLPFDPYDLSGYWIGGGATNRFGMNTPAPPMTPWAQAKYDAAIPGIGPRAKPLGNDPIMICDPISYPRIMLTAGMYGHEIIQLPKKTVWLFDWFYTRRTTWTDGRKLPEDRYVGAMMRPCIAGSAVERFGPGTCGYAGSQVGGCNEKNDPM